MKVVIETNETTFSQHSLRSYTDSVLRSIAVSDFEIDFLNRKNRVMQVRCKMKCTSKTIRGSASHINNEFHFEAVCADEVPENERYHKYTPTGNINITVTNPNVDYEVGKYYYFDSNPAVS